MEPGIVQILTQHVKPPPQLSFEFFFGMQLRKHCVNRYLQHDAVAMGIFNRDYSSAHGAFAAWTTELENSTPLLSLMLERMLSDFERTHAKMRKAYGIKELETGLHSCVSCPCALNGSRDRGTSPTSQWGISGLLGPVQARLSRIFRVGRVCRDTQRAPCHDGLVRSARAGSWANMLTGN